MPPKRTPKTADSKAATTAKAAKPRGRPAAASKTSAAADKKVAPTKKKTTTVTSKKTSQSKTKKPLQEAKANTSAKRKAENDLEEKPQGKRQKQVETTTTTTTTKKQRVIKAPVAPVPKPAKKKVVINTAPTTRLTVFAFGSNSNAELGMGDTFKKAECPRPKFNTVLSDAGVVQISAGGMHGVALTHDNKVLTWGVNDQGALGRDTNWEGGLVDMDKAEESDEDEDEEIEVNPKEATPTVIDLSGVPSGTVFTQVVAADSASFALTDEGLVYGWGTFRNSNGVWGFSPEVKVQQTPILIPGLKNVTKLAAGSNHVLALLTDGSVHSWGSGEQDQLARRLVERRAKLQGLVPQKVGSRRGFVDIAAGADHSFAVYKDGSIFGWGLNNYGQTGIPSKAGESEAGVLKPTVIPSLKGQSKITQIAAGNFNSLAITENNECLVWGRIDNHATGIDPSTLSKDDVIFDERDRPRILANATRIPNLEVAYATYGTEHAIAVTKDGKAYSWGFNSSNQTGQPGDDDIKVATVLNSKAIQEKSFIWAGAGGQYGMIASAATANEDETKPQVAAGAAEPETSA